MTCNFIEEFLVLVGMASTSFAIALLSLGTILAEAYMLCMLQKVALGKSNTKMAEVLPDLSK